MAGMLPRKILGGSWVRPSDISGLAVTGRTRKSLTWVYVGARGGT